MSAKFKIAIRWADGTVLGVVGTGASGDLAKDDAYRQIYELSARKGSFSLIKDLDVYNLPDDECTRIKGDWDRATAPAPSYWGYP